MVKVTFDAINPPGVLLALPAAAQPDVRPLVPAEPTAVSSMPLPLIYWSVAATVCLLSPAVRLDGQ